MPLATGTRAISKTQMTHILEGIAKGATETAAAQSAGVSSQTFKQAKYCDSTLSTAVDRAHAAAEERATYTITSAFDVDDKRVATQNAQWWLERRRRDDYGTPKEAVITVVQQAMREPEQIRDDMRRLFDSIRTRAIDAKQVDEPAQAE